MNLLWTLLYSYNTSHQCYISLELQDPFSVPTSILVRTTPANATPPTRLTTTNPDISQSSAQSQHGILPQLLYAAVTNASLPASMCISDTVTLETSVASPHFATTGTIPPINGTHQYQFH